MFVLRRVEALGAIGDRQAVPLLIQACGRTMGIAMFVLRRVGRLGADRG
jgi:HEAT repeat protein